MRSTGSLTRSINSMIRRIGAGYRVLKSRTNQGPLPDMLQYRLQDDSGSNISFWNDVPIDVQSGTITCGIEIPKQQNGKFEMIKEMPGHPIMQDTRKNLFTKQLEKRYYAQFPLFNYGFIPQTWEQTFLKDSRGYFGDDDPLDICDLSCVLRQPGEFFRGRVLGSICLIDQGETDWKIFVKDEKQCQAQNVNEVGDVDPQWIESIKAWFIGIKVYDGKKENSIAYGGRVLGKSDTMEVVKETHDVWKDLLTSQQAQRVQKRREFHIV